MGGNKHLFPRHCGQQSSGDQIPSTCMDPFSPWSEETSAYLTYAYRVYIMSHWISSSLVGLVGVSHCHRRFSHFFGYLNAVLYWSCYDWGMGLDQFMSKMFRYMVNQQLLFWKAPCPLCLVETHTLVLTNPALFAASTNKAASSLKAEGPCVFGKDYPLVVKYCSGIGHIDGGL